jgi:two-component system response regulator (stage 0 sporulation protein F)
MTISRDDQPISALLVGDFARDRLMLHDIFRKPGWRLFEPANRRRALACMSLHPVHVVLSEAEAPDWNWKRVLADLQKLRQPPQLIVTSDHADDHLWAEVLHVGGFDVLPRPLSRDEAERVISFARRQFGLPRARSAS